MQQSIFYNYVIKPTFITVSDTIEIHIIGMLKEQQAQPGIKCIDWNNKQNSHNPPLLIRVGVILQMLINLKGKLYLRMFIISICCMINLQAK